MVGYAAPVVSSGQTVVFGNANAATQVYGTSTDYTRVQNWSLRTGRSFEPHEETAGSAVCVLGQTVATKLFGNSDPVGQSIRVKNVACLVLGVLARAARAVSGRIRMIWC